MLTIRLQRIGKKKKPFYRVIISEKQKDTQGHYLELLGSYNPHTKVAQLKQDRITYWLGVGARMSNTVHNLFIREGVVTEKDKRQSVKISKKRRAKLDEKKSTMKKEADSPQGTPAVDAAPENAPTASEASPETEKPEAPSPANTNPAEEKVDTE